MQSGMKHQVERIEAGDIKGGAEVNRLEVKENANQVFSILTTMKQHVQSAAQAKLIDEQTAASHLRFLSIAIVALVSLLAMIVGIRVVRSVTTAL
ncbi:hypothetical protein P3T20_001244 [Paraburkholderia sp. GAS206C]|jgi:hypothetical protein